MLRCPDFNNPLAATAISRSSVASIEQSYHPHVASSPLRLVGISSLDQSLLQDSIVISVAGGSWGCEIAVPSSHRVSTMPKRATTTVASLQKATAREEKQLERRKVKLIRMQLDAVLDSRPDLHQSILDFAERLAKKSPKGATLDDDDDDDDDDEKEQGSKVAEKSAKRAPDRAEHKSKQLEEWQRNLSRLSADDLSLTASI